MPDGTRRAVVFASITFASCLAMRMTENTNYLWLIIFALLVV